MVMVMMIINCCILRSTTEHLRNFMVFFSISFLLLSVSKFFFAIYSIHCNSLKTWNKFSIFCVFFSRSSKYAYCIFDTFTQLYCLTVKQTTLLWAYDVKCWVVGCRAMIKWHSVDDRLCENIKNGKDDFVVKQKKI